MDIYKRIAHNLSMEFQYIFLTAILRAEYLKSYA